MKKKIIYVEKIWAWIKKKGQNFGDWVNANFWKIFPYFFGICWFYSFFLLWYFMIDYQAIIFVYAFFWPIFDIVDAMLYVVCYFLGVISDLLFDDNLVLNAKFTTEGDANATEVQALIFKIEDLMGNISFQFDIFQEIIQSTEFLTNLSTYSDITIAKFSILIYLIDSSLSLWIKFEMLEHTIVNHFYSLIYSMSDIYVTNHFWRMFNICLTPLIKHIFLHFQVFLEVYLTSLVELNEFLSNLQRGAISPLDAKVSLEHFRIIFEQHRTILMSAGDLPKQRFFLSEWNMIDVVYADAVNDLEGWLHRVDTAILNYQQYIETPNKSFLWWLRTTHKKAHPQLL